MLPVLTRTQSRELDQRLISKGVPSVVLMENAGRGAAEVIGRELPDATSLLVVSGTGNNGGDGFVVARRWLVWGKPVRVHLAGEVTSLSVEARDQYEAYVAVGGEFVSRAELADTIAASDVVVDAVFGTGLSRPVEGAHAELIASINAGKKPVVALDIPSGLCADTGRVLGVSVKATMTVSFGTAKRGCFTFGGAEFAGAVHVVDIGAPLPLSETSGGYAHLTDGAHVKRVLAARGPVGHKGQAGHVLVIAGSSGTLGAARLTAHGAFRAGAGVVTVATHAEAAAALETGTWEVMVRGLTPTGPELDHWLDNATSVVVGPGLGVSDLAARWLETVLAQFAGVVVLDADGLTLLARQPQLAGHTQAQLVLTPHPGEAARLLDTTTATVEADRFAALDALTRRLNATVVLKGAPSLISGNGHRFIAPRGHACLSCAGAGDVLAGMIGALGAQLPAHDAALAGTWLHATAGERLGGGSFRGRGLLAREIADQVPTLCTELLGA